MKKMILNLMMIIINNYNSKKIMKIMLNNKINNKKIYILKNNSKFKKTY